MSAPPPPAASAGPPPSTPASSTTPSDVPVREPLQAAEVKIHDRKVFLVKVSRGGLSAEQRAHEATVALERAVEQGDEPEVRVVEDKDDVAVVFAGTNPVIQFGQADATAAGDASAKIHADAVASDVRAAIAGERKRNAIALTVFSVSLLILFGLLAFLVLRKLGDLVDRARAWIVENPERLPRLRIANVEVLQRAWLRGAVLVAIDAAKWLLRIGVAYVWLLFALSRFDATRAYGERLGGVVLAPVSALVGRAVSAFPILVVFALAALTVLLVVRFVSLFFASVARGETSVGWLPVDLAGPTSVLVRAGIILIALVLAAPLVTGTDDGALARVGIVALVAVGLASTPLLACMAVGIAVVFGRRVTVGEFAEVGGRMGRVRSLSLLEVCIEDSDGCEVRVPHLAGLVHPTRILGVEPPVRVEVTVVASAPQSKTLEILTHAARANGARAAADLVCIDADGARYSVTVFSANPRAKTTLSCALADALSAAGIALGRSVRPPSPR
jgi:small-conductance mechanosensitive channel